MRVLPMGLFEDQDAQYLALFKLLMIVLRNSVGRGTAGARARHVHLGFRLLKH